MSLFIESIKIEDGQCFNLPLHQARMNRTRKEALDCNQEILLSNVINVSSAFNKGLVKCRVLYGKEIQKVEFGFYHFPQIHSLQIVLDNAIEYTYKSADRSLIEKDYQKRGAADDILIVKNGCITDTSFCNVLLKKEEKYFTPDTFLLNGVKRQQLLQEGKITERHITIGDLNDFDSIHLINAMIDIEDSIQMPVSAIRAAVSVY